MIPNKELSSLIASKNVIAAISCRAERLDSDPKRHELADQYQFDVNSLCIPGQIHSADVLQVMKPGSYSDVDGLVTKNPELVLSLQVADCIPLFLIDETAQVLGLIHAGWRGAAGGITTQALETMFAAGAQPVSLSAIIGPCIRQADFEVGPEFAAMFPSEFLAAGKDDHYFLDLPGFVKVQLSESGISSKNIHDSQLNTYTSPAKYHSYRRDGNNAGRMFAVLGWKKQINAQINTEIK